MLIKPELEKLLPHVDNRYTLAILVAKRVRQLVNGALPLTDSDSHSLVTLASEELAKGKIALVKGSVNPIIPLRPEVEAARMAARAAAEQADLADAVKDALDQAAGIDSAAGTGADDARIISDSLLTVAESPAAENTEQPETDDVEKADTAEEDADEADTAEEDAPDNQGAEAEAKNDEEPDVEDNN